jgi:mono/diheme cytochrome c family protein
MREGRRPDGVHYFPAFPYASFTRIADADLRDLWSYLRSLKPAERPSRPHELGFFFRWRFLLVIWKWLFFTPGPFIPEPAKSALLNRGAYLVRALGHCGECHTPRNFLGAPKRDRALAGAKLGEGTNAPNLTPTRLKKYGDGELKDILQSGLYPDGDVMGDTMSEVVTNSTSQLSAPDLAALIAYLRSLPPLPDAAK